MRRLLLLAACCIAASAGAQAPHEVPLPAAGWVTDLTGTLRPSTVARVNAVADRVDAEGVGQIGVAVVHTSGARSHRAYATALFNAWGVGNAGRNDGVLLFIALGDRKAEIILGSGVDSQASVAVTDRILTQDVTAHMKRGQPDVAVQAAVDSLAAHLRGGPTAHGGGAGPGGRPRNLGLFLLTSRDDFPWWVVLLSAVGLAGGVGGHQYLRRRPRKCRACGQMRVRLGEDEDDAHLSDGERAEERFKSVDYDVWWCDPCGDAQVLRYGRFLSGRRSCAKCGYQTASSQSLTLRAATEYSSGLVEITETCGHCSHIRKYQKTTPRITRSRSSSGSSSGGFGGGSSSGRGSSGGW